MDGTGLDTYVALEPGNGIVAATLTPMGLGLYLTQYLMTRAKQNYPVHSPELNFDFPQDHHPSYCNDFSTLEQEARIEFMDMYTAVCDDLAMNTPARNL